MNCTKCGIELHRGKCVNPHCEIERLTGFLERIRDGKICRRCIKENANGYILMNDEDGSPHDCAREIAREALEDGMP